MAAGEENGELSPFSSAEGCYSQQGEEEPASGMRQKVAAPNPASLNPLFFLNQSSDQEAPPQQQELQQQQGDVGAGPNGAVPIRRRRTGHDKQERAQAAAAAADHPRVAGGKRKASVEAPLESEPPAVKRQASRKSLAIPGEGLDMRCGLWSMFVATREGQCIHLVHCLQLLEQRTPQAQQRPRLAPRQAQRRCCALPTAPAPHVGRACPLPRLAHRRQGAARRPSCLPQWQSVLARPKKLMRHAGLQQWPRRRAGDDV